MGAHDWGCREHAGSFGGNIMKRLLILALPWMAACAAVGTADLFCG